MAGLFTDTFISAGPLDRRIRLQRYRLQHDAFNAQVRVWYDLAEVWASKDDLSDSERIAAQEKGTALSTRWQIRYSKTVADLSPKDRLYEVFTKRTYDIQAVKELGRRVGLELSTNARLDLSPTGELNPQ